MIVSLIIGERIPLKNRKAVFITEVMTVYFFISDS